MYGVYFVPKPTIFHKNRQCHKSLPVFIYVYSSNTILTFHHISRIIIKSKGLWIMNKDLKQKYKAMFDIVRGELNKVDPMGLEPNKFCPIDEYDPETEMVLAEIKDRVDYIELAKHIGLIFSKMFDNDFSESMFYDCARNILEQISAL